VRGGGAPFCFYVPEIGNEQKGTTSTRQKRLWEGPSRGVKVGETFIPFKSSSGMGTLLRDGCTPRFQLALAWGEGLLQEFGDLQWSGRDGLVGWRSREIVTRTRGDQELGRGCVGVLNRHGMGEGERSRAQARLVPKIHISQSEPAEARDRVTKTELRG